MTGTWLNNFSSNNVKFSKEYNFKKLAKENFEDIKKYIKNITEPTGVEYPELNDYQSVEDVEIWDYIIDENGRFESSDYYQNHGSLLFNLGMISYIMNIENADDDSYIILEFTDEDQSVDDYGYIIYKNCAIEFEKVGHMYKPVDIVYGNCREKFKKEVQEYIDSLKKEIQTQEKILEKFC